MNWRKLWPQRRNPDLDEELESHLRMAVADRIARGESPSSAELNARREFGNELLVRETTRDFWPWAASERLAQDLRYAGRRMAANKLFTAAAVLTLALGIGVNTAIFTLVRAVLYNRLPVSHPEELYRLGKGDGCCVMSGYQNRQDFALFSYAFYRALREGTPEIGQLAAFQASPQLVSARLAGAAAGVPLKTEYVSANYFTLFGVQPKAGAFFSAEAESRGAAPTLVLSHRAWQAYFAGNASIVGSTLLIKSKSFTVIGIAPPGFYGETLRGNPPDCWLPAATEPLVEDANSLYVRPGKMWLYVMGRIAPGASLRALESKINAQAKRWYLAQAGESASALTRQNIENQFIPIVPAPGGVETMSMAYRNGLTLLMTLSSLVLLIACANVANLLLARASTMRPQNSLKIALGASRARMLRQALLDSLLLAVLGCTAGLAVSYGGARLMIALAFQGARYVPIDAAPSLTILAFAIAVSLATGLLFGAVPAWVETRSDPASVLRGSSRSVHSGSMLPQRVLVVAQTALSFALLAGAGLLTQSLWRLEGQPWGFETKDRVVVQTNPSFTSYTADRLVATYHSLEDRLSHLPRVRGVGIAMYLPMTGNNWNDSVYLSGSPTPLQRSVSYDRVNAGYFDAIGTRIIQGRAIDETDQLRTPQSVVVSRAFVDLCCKGRNVIGLHFGTTARDSNDYEVVGVAEDAVSNNPYRPAYPTFFLPIMHPDVTSAGKLTADDFAGGIVLRVSGAAASIEPAVRNAIASVDPNLGVLQVIGYPEQLALNFNKERLLATLTQLFGALALVLAAIGLYGLVALSADRRTAEIGIRIALGASRQQVIRMILSGALLQVGAGIALGLPLSYFGRRLIEHQLYGVSASNPLTLAGAAIILTLCAAAAALVPAARAAVIDPMRALRAD